MGDHPRDIFVATKLIGVAEAGPMFISLNYVSGEGTRGWIFNQLDGVVRVLRCVNQQFVVAGDFHMTRSELVSTGWGSAFRGPIVADGQGTCTSRSA